jgi:hypothetical protein
MLANIGFSFFKVKVYEVVFRSPHASVETFVFGGTEKSIKRRISLSSPESAALRIERVIIDNDLCSLRTFS